MLYFYLRSFACDYYYYCLNAALNFSDEWQKHISVHGYILALYLLTTSAINFILFLLREEKKTFFFRSSAQNDE